MSFNQEDVNKFDEDWDKANSHLGSMMSNKIVSVKMYREFSARVRSLESLVMDISDDARSDKD